MACLGLVGRPVTLLNTHFHSPLLLRLPYLAWFEVRPSLLPSSCAEFGSALPGAKLRYQQFNLKPQSESNFTAFSAIASLAFSKVGIQMYAAVTAPPAAAINGGNLCMETASAPGRAGPGRAASSQRSRPAQRHHPAGRRPWDKRGGYRVRFGTAGPSVTQKPAGLNELSLPRSARTRRMAGRMSKGRELQQSSGVGPGRIAGNWKPVQRRARYGWRRRDSVAAGRARQTFNPDVLPGISGRRRPGSHAGSGTRQPSVT